MDEVLPGVLHWTAFHDGIGQPVHSHLDVASGAVFDPLLPPGATAEALADAAIPSVVLLSNRHHLRDAARIADAFGVPIRCHEAGLHAFGDGDPDVEGFAYGDEVAPGVVALELGALTPEDTVYHLAAGPGALLFADGLTRPGGDLGYVPDGLMGDDPAAVRRDLTARLGELAARDDYDALLFAHGEPLPAGGRAALRAFVAARAD
jgi:hypothetical protein